MRKTARTVVITILLASVFSFSTIGYSQQGDPRNGKRIYEQFCVPCHGPEGKGDGTRAKFEQFDPMPRNHTNGEYMNKRPYAALVDVEKNSGKAQNFSHIMPAWKTVLADDQIHDVLSYVRSLAVPPYPPGTEDRKGR